MVAFFCFIICLFCQSSQSVCELKVVVDQCDCFYSFIIFFACLFGLLFACLYCQSIQSVC